MRKGAFAMASIEHARPRGRAPEHRFDVSSAFRALVERRFLPLLLLAGASVLLVSSIFLPYWQLTLHAPQYPKGLPITAYVNHLTGQVAEVDGLNHYIGMMKLHDAARLEQTIAPFAIPVVALLALASFWVRGRWKWAFIAPAVSYPIAFVVDLAAWLYYAGHSLDPHAALHGAIKPFTPHVFGEGRIGQFSTQAHFDFGFYFALIGAILVVVATILERRASHVTR